MPKFLRHIYFALLCALPAVLFFSYHPIISLGANSSMNFELSLPLIWLVFFDLVAFIVFLTWWRKWNHGHKGSFATLFASIKTQARAPERRSRKIIAKLLAYLAFSLYVTISIFWSPNPLRAFLTAGIIWLLFFAILAILRLSPLLEPPSRFKIRLLGTFFISTAIICLFCFIQSLLDSCGLSRETTLLCAGCTYRSFGFPHPNGFAIEPQFMGNLLLAPTLLALYLLCLRNPGSYKPKQRRSANVAELAQATELTPANGFGETEQISRTEHPGTEQPSEQATSTFPHLRKTPIKISLVIFAILFSTTLFFTFSRGAIYSYALGLLILIIFALHRHTFRPALIVIPVATFLLSLGLQGTFAQLGPTSETFTSAVTKSIHQLSLGLIDFRNTTVDGGSNIPSEDISTPAFDGYVAESTNVRLGLSSTALATWSKSPLTMLFGVGLGGAGTAMHATYPTEVATPKEIVQNQPISLLLETGLLGVVFLLLALVSALQAPIQHFLKNPTVPAHLAVPLLIALSAAYLFSLQFFAGLPNALHIYLLPPLLYLIFQSSSLPGLQPKRNP